MIGDVPYINGGIFAVHPIEDANEIEVGETPTMRPSRLSSYPATWSRVPDDDAIT